MSKRLNIDEFRVFREHFQEVCGLYFADDRYSRVAEVVGSRMSELAIQCFGEYERVLTSSPRNKDELATLFSLLTIGETHFFRNKNHWQAFAEYVLPRIAQRNAATGDHRIRIWSAGCSTGEEAYTASIVLSRSLPDLARWSIEIIGTDINPAAIAAAERALYTENSFRGVPPAIKNEYFEPAGKGRYRLRDDIREMVRFQEMNFLDKEATAGINDVDIIFCCNVLIYFDASGIERAMAQFHRSLRPDGYLFLGHAESIHGNLSEFDCLNVCNTFIYKPGPCAVRPIETLPDLDRGPFASTTAGGSVEALHPIPEQRWPIAEPTNNADAAVCPPVQAPLHIPTDAVEISQRGTDVPSEPVSAPEVPALDALRIRATEQLLEGKNIEAQHTFEEILKREPNDPESLLGMALLLADSGSNEAALEHCQRVFQVQPMSAEAYYVTALVHESLGEDATAQREFEKSIYLDNNFSISYFRLAARHDRKGRRDAAMREFSNTLKALPDDDELRVRLYSGGFSKETLAQICQRRLGIESAADEDADAPALADSSYGSEGVSK